jgi:hypothetical protein
MSMFSSPGTSSSSSSSSSSTSPLVVSKDKVIEKLKALKLLKTKKTAPKIGWMVTGDDHSVCGQIEYVREWTTLAGASGGFLIQKVTRSFDVYQWDKSKGGWKSAPMSGTDIDDLVKSHSSASATISQYWEAWEIDGSGETDSADGFNLCSIVPVLGESNAPFTTKGTYVITGDVAYFPDLTASDMTSLGFTVLKDHPANGLLATDTDPGLDIAGDASHVGFTLRVTWDSGDADPDHAETKFVATRT